MSNAARPNLIIAGASARAAAASALRAGFQPACVDLFADRDLAAQCRVVRVAPQRYPRNLSAALAKMPAGPWLYTGALENHPTIVAGVRRPLLGNPPAVLRHVRDPVAVSHCLRKEDLPCPALATEQVDPQRRWLCKPLRGAGGAGIHAFAAGMPRAQHYLQEWIDGPSYGAFFLARSAGTELFGITRQLVGAPWLHAKPFHYCGSVGPVHLPGATTKTVQRLGSVLAAHFGLRGLFGVDFILHDGHPWLIEVNPRYTASVEIHERATGRTLLADHVAAFPEVDVQSEASHAAVELPRPGRIHGKAILFADRAICWPAEGSWCDSLESLTDLTTWFADIPAAGTLIEEGQPVCTLFAEGMSEEECLRLLAQRADNLQAQLKESESSL